MAEGIRLVAIFDGLRRYGNAHAIWHTCRSCMGDCVFRCRWQSKKSNVTKVTVIKEREIPIDLPKVINRVIIIFDYVSLKTRPFE